MPRRPPTIQKRTAQRWTAMLGCTAAGFLSVALFASEARAACTLSTGKAYMSVNIPAWSPPTFDPTVPDGTVLFSSKGQATGDGATVSCTSYIAQAIYAGKGPLGRFNTYATPVAGVGVRIIGGYDTSSWWPQEFYYTTREHPFVGGGTFTVELVKTGPITAAGELTGEIGTTTLTYHGNQVIRRVFLTGSLPIRPLVPACKVLTPSVSVPLGKIPLYAFKGVGTTTAAQPFEIRLQCSGGTQGTSTRMYITMTDSSNWANRTSTLSLSRDSNASGVGIQVLRGADDSLVSYGPDSSQSNNPNQWFVGQYGNVPVTIPFKARYVQTTSTVTPGVAKGIATFTMSYQ